MHGDGAPRAPRPAERSPVSAPSAMGWAERDTWPAGGRRGSAPTATSGTASVRPGWSSGRGGSMPVTARSPVGSRSRTPTVRGPPCGASAEAGGTVGRTPAATRAAARPRSTPAAGRPGRGTRPPPGRPLISTTGPRDVGFASVCVMPWPKPRALCARSGRPRISGSVRAGRPRRPRARSPRSAAASRPLAGHGVRLVPAVRHGPADTGLRAAGELPGHRAGVPLHARAVGGDRDG